MLEKASNKIKVNLRKLILVIFDLIVVSGCFTIAVCIFDSSLLGGDMFYASLPIQAVLFFDVLFIFGCYDIIWRYASPHNYVKLFVVSVFSQIVFFVIAYVFLRISFFPGFMIFSSLIPAIIVVLARMVYQAKRRTLTGKSFARAGDRLMIIGAGEAAYRLLGEFGRRRECSPVCLVDDDSQKYGRKIGSVKVMGDTSKIPALCKRLNIDTIIFAIPSCSLEDQNRILSICFKTNCDIKVLPAISQLLIDKKSQISDQLREVRLEDLLGREPLSFDAENIKKLIGSKVCLVTGGGGSIGSELCRQIASFAPSKLIIVDNYENNAYCVEQEILKSSGRETELFIEIASVQDKDKIDYLFGKYHPNLVFHAAAHKHVPLMETNPEEAVKNNILGTLNVTDLSAKHQVEKFVLISSDKAVNPTSIMGATKRCCEMIVQSFAQNPEYKTSFIAVRFGNVLGSNGSVVPLFESQIENGGPVTVTHRDITRYFMTIPEAVSLVLQSSCLGSGGEIFILNMGKPVKILDLAENMIRLSGLIPYRDIDIKFVGLRPGEKLHEELLMPNEDVTETSNNKIFKGRQVHIDSNRLFSKIEQLDTACNEVDKPKIVEILSDIVETFNKSN